MESDSMNRRVVACWAPVAPPPPRRWRWQRPFDLWPAHVLITQWPGEEDFVVEVFDQEHGQVWPDEYCATLSAARQKAFEIVGPLIGDWSDGDPPFDDW
jgi:hypothetical protein